MASRVGLSYRQDAAFVRIGDALVRINSSLGIETPEFPDVRFRDPAHRETARIEWIAEVLDAIAGSAAKTPGPAQSRKSQVKAGKATKADPVTEGNE